MELIREDSIQFTNDTTVSGDDFTLNEVTRYLIDGYILSCLCSCCTFKHICTSTRCTTIDAVASIQSNVCCKVQCSKHLNVEQICIVEICSKCGIGTQIFHLHHTCFTDHAALTSTSLVRIISGATGSNQPVITKFQSLIRFGHTITSQLWVTIYIVYFNKLTQFKRNDTVLSGLKCSRFGYRSILRCQEFGSITSDICSTRTNLNCKVFIRCSNTISSGIASFVNTIIEEVIQVFTSGDIETIYNVVTRLLISTTSKRTLQFGICSLIDYLLNLTLIDTEEFDEVLIRVIVDCFFDQSGLNSESMSTRCRIVRRTSSIIIQ